MALRVLACLTVFLWMALSAEAAHYCLAGERISCNRDSPDCNVTFPGPLWIQACEEHHNACFNATYTYTTNEVEGGNTYTNETFGCINTTVTGNQCEDGPSVLEREIPAVAVGFELSDKKYEHYGVAVSEPTYATCFCQDDNCNGMLNEREIADNNNRADSVVWPIVIWAMVATVVLIAIGASVSLCT